MKSSPKAWMQKWYLDGEIPAKIKNEKGRWVWPAKYKFHAVTTSKCLADDVPLSPSNLLGFTVELFVWDGDPLNLPVITDGSIMAHVGSVSGPYIQFKGLRCNGSITQGGWLLIFNGGVVHHGHDLPRIK